MRQPKKLHIGIEYSGDIFVPEFDMELDEYLKIHHEHLDSHNLHEELEGEHVGEGVFLTEDFEIDSAQFEEKEDKAIPQKQAGKSFLKRLIN